MGQQHNRISTSTLWREDGQNMMVHPSQSHYMKFSVDGSVKPVFIISAYYLRDIIEASAIIDSLYRRIIEYLVV